MHATESRPVGLEEWRFEIRGNARSLRPSAALGSSSSSGTRSCARRSRRRWRRPSRCRSSRGPSTCPGARRICVGSRPRSKRRAFERSLDAGAGARVRSREGAASPPGPRPARGRPLRPSVDHAPPVHRRLVVADRVQGACGDLRGAARWLGASAPRGVPVRRLHPLALRADGELRGFLEGRARRSSRSRRRSILAYPTSANERARRRRLLTLSPAETEHPAVRSRGSSR